MRQHGVLTASIQREREKNLITIVNCTVDGDGDHVIKE